MRARDASTKFHLERIAFHFDRIDRRLKALVIKEIRLIEFHLHMIKHHNRKLTRANGSKPRRKK